MSTANATLLQARGLSKKYGPNTVLVDTHLDVSAGEVLALVGENGSGKSTLAKILAGVIRHDHGDIIVHGDTVRIANPRYARSLGICYVAQEPAVVPTMSVLQNLLMSRQRWSNLGSPGRRERAAAAESLARVGLETPLSARVRDLSAGEQSLLDLARALIDRPRILILDEVTTRLPEPQVVLDLVADFARQNIASIFITHRFPELRRCADRAVVLRDGRIVADVARASMTDATLGRHMVGRELELLERRPGAPLGAVALDVRGLVVRGARSPVSFELRAGEIVGIAGIMGSGRSELLETVAGSRAPSTGSIHAFGAAIPPGSISVAKASGIGFVPEDRDRQGLMPRASITANIRANAYRTAAIARARTDRNVAEEMKALLGIKSRGVDAPVNSLSGGNAQKVLFARELARKPRILVLDEPTRGVDIAARADIYRLIRDHTAAGGAVLMASSDLHELVTLADRILVLYDGKVTGELHGEQISEESIVLLASGAAAVVDNHIDDFKQLKEVCK